MDSSFFTLKACLLRNSEAVRLAKLRKAQPLKENDKAGFATLLLILFSFKPGGRFYSRGWTVKAALQL